MTILQFPTMDKQNDQIATSDNHAFSLDVLFMFWESTYSGDRASFILFFAWLFEQLRSCDGLNFSQLKAHLFIQDKNQSTHYFEMCSPEVW